MACEWTPRSAGPPFTWTSDGNGAWGHHHSSIWSVSLFEGPYLGPKPESQKINNKKYPVSQAVIANAELSLPMLGGLFLLPAGMNLGMEDVQFMWLGQTRHISPFFWRNASTGSSFTAFARMLHSPPLQIFNTADAVLHINMSTWLSFQKKKATSTSTFVCVCISISLSPSWKLPPG